LRTSIRAAQDKKKLPITKRASVTARDEQLNKSLTKAITTLTKRLAELTAEEIDRNSPCISVVFNAELRDRVLTIEASGFLQMNRCGGHFPTDSRVGLLARVTKSTLRTRTDSPQRKRSVDELLRAWGAGPIDELSDAGFVRNLGALWAIRDILVESTFGSRHKGIDISRVGVRPALADSPSLPRYVYEARAVIPEPHFNRPKAYLTQWTGPILDSKLGVTLHVGHRDAAVSSGIFDYWTTLAVREKTPQLTADLRDHHSRLDSLSRQLYATLTVVSADDKVLLARRTKASGIVDALPGYWMTSIGESVDGVKDRDNTHTPNPIRTIRRCLVESDELNLSAADIHGARVTCLGLVTPWRWILTSLLVLVELPVPIDRIFEAAIRGENDQYDSIDFDIVPCLALIRAGEFSAKPRSPEPLAPLASVGLLLSLFSRYGFEEVLAEIAASI
jgi:hypothetical protein